MIKVLVVEDEEKIARFIELELIHEGYKVIKVNNGREGLEIAEKGEVDLVLLDVMLPELNGLEVLRRLRKTSDIPVIMLTARDAVMDKVSGLDAGADDFNEEEDCYEILTSPEEFDAVNQALADAGVTFASAEVTMIPQTTVDLTSEDDIKKMNRILGLLDEDDDVQNVYHNWNEPEEDEE